MLLLEWEIYIEGAREETARISIFMHKFWLWERIASIEASAFSALALLMLIVVARFDRVSAAFQVNLVHLRGKDHFMQVPLILNIILGAIGLLLLSFSLQVQLIPLGGEAGWGSVWHSILALLAMVDAWLGGAFGRLLVLLVF